MKIWLFAVHSGIFGLSLHLLGLVLGECLVHLFGDNLEKCLVDFSLTISRETSIGAGNPVEEEKDVKQDGSKQENKGKCPDDKGKGHTGQNGGLASVFLGKGFDPVKESCECLVDGMSLGGKLGFVDGLEGKSVDNLAGTRANEDANPRLEAEVSEEGNILCSLFTLCQ